MLLWTAFFVILLAFAAPTTHSEESAVASPFQITVFVVGSLVFITVAGIITLVVKNRTGKNDEVLYQSSGANVAKNIGVEPRYIVAPVPKKPTPNFLDQKFDKPFVVPKITINPPESHSQ